MILRFARLKIFILFSFLYFHMMGQELEPRSITNLPVGMNFVLGGYAYAGVNTLLDPAFPIQEIDSRVHTLAGAYARSINFFGLSSKVDVVLPYIAGYNEGEYLGREIGLSRSGFGDLRMRFSFNFVGSKAMNVMEYQYYSPGLVSGISVQLIAPTGFYSGEYLINIGANRWVVKPQWGVAKNYKTWIFEGYLGVWLFGENKDFLQGNSLKQEPLYVIKGHVIKSLKNRKWLSVSAGYAMGGNTKINDEARQTEISNLRLALMYAIPLSKNSSLKFSAVSGIRFKKGTDYDGLAVVYQYNWIDKKELMKLKPK